MYRGVVEKVGVWWYYIGLVEMEGQASEEEGGLHCFVDGGVC